MSKSYGKKKLTLKQRIAGTAGFLLLFRLLSFVPLPFVDSSVVKSLIEGNGSLGLLNLLTGGNLGNMSVMALGITPYITASIILQLMGVLIPKLTEIQKDGTEGQKKYKKITIALATVLALVESIGLMVGYGRQGILMKMTWYTVLIPALIMMIGTFGLSCMGQFIDARLFGNGTSLILVTGILCSYVEDALTLGRVLIVGKSIPVSILFIILAAICVILLFAFTTFISVCEKKVSVTYSAKMTGRQMKQTSTIPLKLIGGGVIPIIFASTLITFPSLVQSFLGTDVKWLHIFNTAHWLKPDEIWASIGLVAYLAMIIGFSYYYQELSLNVMELANNLKTKGGTIPGIRPGTPTVEYLNRQLKWLTALGGICLCVIAVIPMILSSTLGIANLSFLGTSIIITVSVIDETMKKYKSETMVGKYTGKGARLFHA